MRQLLVLWVGRHDREPWRSLSNDFVSRISHHWKIEQRQIRVRERDEAKRQAAEASAVLTAVPAGATLCALDARGKSRSSEAFSRFLSSAFETSQGPVTFVVGGDLGLHHGLLRAVHYKIAFGPMTLPHELARVVLLEQLYRALAIETGIKYHREPF